QQLLSLYHSLPKLKYQTFERLLNKNDIKELNIKHHKQYMYPYQRLCTLPILFASFDKNATLVIINNFIIF
ncbi:hypothetical protein, partial [Streptococcus pneumoniae]|uniref:hypothetical protein n=1 Tax=Streptococcus pneumoniae TaxID=1313 RepID=UPI00125531C7